MRGLALATALAGILLTAPAAAAEFEGFGYGAAELYTRGDQPGGHGIAIAGARLRGLHRGAEVSALLNTDTLHLGFDHWSLNDDWWLGATLSGEVYFAGLLIDYHERGELLAERGFAASFVGGSAHVSTRREDHLFIRLEWTARQYFFDALPETSPSYVLPPTTILHSPRFYATWWDFEFDPSHDEWHRPFQRREGFGFGVSFGVDARDRASRWGDLTSDRNTPSEFSAVATQWLGWGVRLGESWRFEVNQESGVMTDADDLNRQRIGGMNPYVTRVSGAPWASHLASAWLAGDLGPRVAVGESMELGLRLDAALIDDPDRSGDSAAGVVAGAAAELDWRPAGDWQIDASVGYSPQLGQWRSTPHLGAYLGVGKSF